MALAWLIALSAWTGPSFSTEEDEYRVQAAFLFNFAKFVQWPDRAFPSADASLVVGVLGKDPFGAHLAGLQSAMAQGHPLEVRRLAGVAQAPGCHILYVSRSEQPHLTSILSALGASSVLTVSECAGFARAGGVVEFVVVNDSVRFKVNLDAALGRDLKPSSQLLGVAVEVIRK